MSVGAGKEGAGRAAGWAAAAGRPPRGLRGAPRTRGRRGCGSRRGAGAGGMDLDAALLAAGANASNTSAGPDNLTAAGEWGRGEPAPALGGAGEASPLSPTAWETFLRAPQPAGLRGKGRGARGRGAGACGAPSRGSPRVPRALCRGRSRLEAPAGDPGCRTACGEAAAPASYSNCRNGVRAIPLPPRRRWEGAARRASPSR